MPRFALAIALALAATACGGGEDDDGSTGGGGEGASGGGGGGTGGCTPGTLALEDGSCRPAGLPADECPPDAVDVDGACRPAGIGPDDCAPGFVHDGDRSCTPTLPTGPCPNGEMAVPGEATCRPVAPCGTGTYGDIPTDATTEHVDANAGGGANGSASNPWPTIQQGINAAANGAIVAVAAGTYNESLSIDGKTITLWGRCPELVSVQGGNPAALLIIDGADNTVARGLALSSAGLGVAVSGALDVLLDQLWVHDTGDPGIVLEPAFGDTRARLENSLVERATQVGVFASGSELDVAATVVRTTQLSAGAARGFGIQASPSSGQPAQATITTSVVEDIPETGIYLAGADLTVSASVVRTTPGAPGSAGLALSNDGPTGELSTASLEDVVVDGIPEFGIVAGGIPLDLEDVVLRQIGVTDGAEFPAAMLFDEGIVPGPSAVTARGLVIDGARYGGVLIAASDVDLERVAIHDVIPAEDGTNGWGLTLWENGPAMTGAQGTLRGIRIERATEVALLVDGSGVTVDGLHIADTQPGLVLNGAGIGVAAIAGQQSATPATFHARRILIERSHLAGLVTQGADLLLDVSEVRETRSTPVGSYGRGIFVQPSFFQGVGSTGALTSVLVDDSRDMGILFTSTAGSIAGCLVRATRANAGGTFGDGIAVANSGSFDTLATITDTLVADADRAGLSSFGGQLVLADDQVDCATFALNGEDNLQGAFAVEDAGGNVCGCGDERDTCKVLSSGLSPPEAYEF